MAYTSGNDINILQASDSSVVGAGDGNDKYLLAPNQLLATQTISISDASGSNTLELMGGLTIVSSKVSGNAIQLILSNGATVNVLGADTFTFEMGGNPLSGQAGIIQTFAQFVTTSLGLAGVPAGSQVISGTGNIAVNADGSTNASTAAIILNPGTTTPVNATPAADIFSFNVAAAKALTANTQIPITGFDVVHDMLQINTATALTNVTLAALNGVDGIGVQPNAITNSTVINFGSDANGDVISITLAGVVDPALVHVNGIAATSVTPGVLTFSTTTFTEASANNGTIGNTSTLTLVGDTFTGSDNDDWSAIVSNVPAGLTASLIRTSATTATLSLTGNATAHANANDVSNLTVTFGDAKFTGGSAAAVTNATKNNLVIDYADPEFSVTDSGAGAYVVSTGHGNVVVTDDGTNYVFTPATGTAVTVAKAGVNSLIVNTITLTGTAAVLSGETITGTGIVAVTALNATPAVDLSLITTTTLTATASGSVKFTGDAGNAKIIVASGIFELGDTANVNATGTLGANASFEVQSSAILALYHQSIVDLTTNPADGLTITGDGTVWSRMTVHEINYSNVAASINLVGICGSINLSGLSETFSRVDTFSVENGQTLTVNAAQAAGKLVSRHGGVTITGSDGAQTINVETTGTNTINPGAGLDQVTLGSGADTVVINAGTTGLASDSAPGYGGVAHTIDIINGFNISSDKLQLSGGAGVLADGSYTVGTTSITVANGFLTATNQTDGNMLITELLILLSTTTNSVAFNAGTDTYVVQGDGVAGGQISDIVVKLVGISVNDLPSILSHA